MCLLKRFFYCWSAIIFNAFRVAIAVAPLPTAFFMGVLTWSRVKLWWRKRQIGRRNSIWPWVLGWKTEKKLIRSPGHRQEDENGVMKLPPRPNGILMVIILVLLVVWLFGHDSSHSFAPTNESITFHSYTLLWYLSGGCGINGCKKYSVSRLTCAFAKQYSMWCPWGGSNAKSKFYFNSYQCQLFNWFTVCTFVMKSWDAIGRYPLVFHLEVHFTNKRATHSQKTFHSSIAALFFSPQI